MSANTTGDVVSRPSETTPLLRDDTEGAENGLINSGEIEEGSAPESAEDSSVPLAVEPTSKELLSILASTWLGVFLAALGIYLTTSLQKIKDCMLITSLFNE